MRFGFKGSNKNISIEYSKFEFMEVDEGILKIGKSGRENPFLFSSDYLDTICAIVSLIENGAYKVISLEEQKKVS